MEAVWVVPMPKAGKNKKHIASYRPIVLMSHLSKLVDKLLILARLRLIVERE